MRSHWTKVGPTSRCPREMSAIWMLGHRAHEAMGWWTRRPAKKHRRLKQPSEAGRENQNRFSLGAPQKEPNLPRFYFELLVPKSGELMRGGISVCCQKLPHLGHFVVEATGNEYTEESQKGRKDESKKFAPNLITERILSLSFGNLFPYMHTERHVGR